MVNFFRIRGIVYAFNYFIDGNNMKRVYISVQERVKDAN